MNTSIKPTDLHIHSIYSDGTDTPAELIDNLRNRGIGTFSVTDHDTLEFYDNFDVASLGGMELICGIEFSCITEVKKCHILGYGMDIGNPRLADAIAEARILRARKLEVRLNFLREVHSVNFSSGERRELEAMNSVGKPHIARMLVDKGLADTIGDAIRLYLTGLPKEDDRLDARTAVSAITEAGGIPVWAHPLGGEGEKPLTAEVFERQLNLLESYGIKGLECYYSRYDKSKIDFLLNYARERGLAVSGGSDYHGAVKDIEPGELSASKELCFGDQLTILGKLSSGQRLQL